MTGHHHVFHVLVVDIDVVEVLICSRPAGAASGCQVQILVPVRVVPMIRERVSIATIEEMDEDALNRCRAAQKVVVCVLAVPVGKRQRGMQKAAAARAYGEGGQQQRGRGVRGYQEAAPERVSAVASLLGGRRGGLTMWARAWTWAYRAISGSCADVRRRFAGRGGQGSQWAPGCGSGAPPGGR